MHTLVWRISSACFSTATMFRCVCWPQFLDKVVFIFILFRGQGCVILRVYAVCIDAQLRHSSFSRALRSGWGSGLLGGMRQESSGCKYVCACAR